MTKKKPLTEEQIADAKRLKMIYETKKEALGLSQDSIAHSLGMGQSAVAQIFNGINGIPPMTGAALARILQVYVDDFSPALANDIATMARSIKTSSLKPDQEPAYEYPLLTGEIEGIKDMENTQLTGRDAIRWISSTMQASPFSFWLEVKNDSMTAPPGVKPSFPEGILILVDPAQNVKPGDFCVVRFDGDIDLTFRKLISEAGERLLKPLNSSYKTKNLNELCKIEGKVIQSLWSSLD